MFISHAFPFFIIHCVKLSFIMIILSQGILLFGENATKKTICSSELWYFRTLLFSLLSSSFSSSFMLHFTAEVLQDFLAPCSCLQLHNAS